MIRPILLTLVAVGCSQGLTPLGNTPTFPVDPDDTDTDSDTDLPIDTDVPVDPPNNPPTANAGPDQTLPAGAVVSLDGSNSSDPDGDVLNFLWVMQSSPPAWSGAIINDNRSAAQFFADQAGTYVLELQVDDGEFAATDTVSVTIEQQNNPPVANAGADQFVDVGSTVYLNGSNSYDPDPGDALSFQWTVLSQPGGSNITFSNPSSAAPTFTATAAGVYNLQLVVTDSAGAASLPDSVRVTAQSTSSGGGGDSGGCFSCVAAQHHLRSRTSAPGFLLFPLLFVVARRRR